jgi:glycosyltransferase involved in cell wall biosynthesis
VTSAGGDPRISVCIVTRNEADSLPGCLESVRWADEVVVMDLESSDGSAEIAERYGARVIRREPVSVVRLVRNEVAEAATGDWILSLDPDERTTPKLAKELRHISRREDVDAVEIPFMHLDFGRPPTDPLRRYDLKARFYRPDRVSWSPTTNRLVTGSRERLLTLPRDDERVILHERDRDVTGLLDRAMRVAPAEARALLDQGETFSARRMLGVLAEKSHKQLVYGRALDDGVPGLIRAGAKIAGHFYVWAALWDLSGRPSTAADDRFLRRLGAVLRGGWTAVRPFRPAYLAIRRVARAWRRSSPPSSGAQA